MTWRFAFLIIGNFINHCNVGDTLHRPTTPSPVVLRWLWHDKGSISPLPFFYSKCRLQPLISNVGRSLLELRFQDSTSVFDFKHRVFDFSVRFQNFVLSFRSGLYTLLSRVPQRHWPAPRGSQASSWALFLSYSSFPFRFKLQPHFRAQV